MKFPIAITEDQAKALLRHIHGKRLSVEERVRVVAVACLLEQALSAPKPLSETRKAIAAFGERFEALSHAGKVTDPILANPDFKSAP